MDKISVIIPAYNVEQYVTQCLKSVCHQTYKNLEIIVVDDGSTDHTGEICDAYKEADNRVIVIHKSNGGLSAARNSGLAIATGDYIGFVDSDDWLSLKTYELLFSRMLEDNADIVQGKYVKVYHDGHQEVLSAKLGAGIYNPDEMFLHLMNEHAMESVVVWNKLVKREIIEGLSFPEGKVYEDEFMMHQLFYRCKAISVVDDVVCYYRQNDQSITHDCGRKILDLFDAFRSRILFFEENHLEQYIPMMEARYYEFVTKIFISVYESEGKDRELILDRLRDEMHRLADCGEGKVLGLFDEASF